MDEEIETLLVRVRADTGGFARDVKEMRDTLEGPFAAGVERAGAGVERALLRAVRSGKLGFDELRDVAAAALGSIAASALDAGLGSLAGGIGGGGLLGALASLIGGAPGRATGGPVSPGRPYWVGERGPELFVPTSSGSVAAATSPAGGREVRVTINLSGGGEPHRALAQSSRQVARAVRAALEGA